MAGRVMYEFDYDIDGTSPKKTEVEVQYSRKKVATDKQKNKKTNLKQSMSNKNKASIKKQNKSTSKQKDVKKVQQKNNKRTVEEQQKSKQKKMQQNGHKKTQIKNGKKIVVKKTKKQQKLKKNSQPKLQPKPQSSISPELEKKFWSRVKTITSLVVVFAVVLSIGYRNAQIDEGFVRVEKLKTQLSELKKENEQLEVTIENNLNLSSVEEIAREILGMRKLDNSQKVYISLPKRDYIEPATEKVITEEPSFFEKIVKLIQNIW